MNRNLSFRLLLLVAAAGFATAASITIPADLYGHLDQNTTDFCLSGTGASFGCGPVATANSFLMLDNKYGSELVKDLNDDGSIDNAELASTAEILSGANYMGCSACSGGTTVANLIKGKNQFFSDFAVGLYYVHASQNPTFQWLFDELTRGQDIEILVGFYDGTGANANRTGGHYLTLNGISWTDTDGNSIITSNEANMSYIDPSGGTDGASSIYNFLGGSLGTSYGAPAGGATVIEWAVAESPVPEPSTFALLIGGMVILAVRRRMRN